MSCQTSRKRFRIWTPIVLAVFIVFGTGLVSGCMSQRTVGEMITVEGIVTVRGNEPFTRVILYTAERNSYILILTPEQRTNLMTPTRQLVNGRLYLGQWNGRPYAHIEVHEISTMRD